MTTESFIGQLYWLVSAFGARIIGAGRHDSGTIPNHCVSADVSFHCCASLCWLDISAGLAAAAVYFDLAAQCYFDGLSHRGLNPRLADKRHPYECLPPRYVHDMF
jgi:hypothetical protein